MVWEPPDGAASAVQATRLVAAGHDAVLETVSEWQGRPLDACYPLVFFDAIRVKNELKDRSKNRPKTGALPTS